ncbi:hypothetical protein BASA81_008592 [Batrachochytrium salamandrivorans]|nr:hypothetical protein BASA81_008592 [Batrachochytrium salamandrivorans]
MSAAPSILRSCDCCIASKVKCSGGHPCTRCSIRSVDCFYRARKKRLGTKMKQQLLLQGNPVAPAPDYDLELPLDTNVLEDAKPNKRVEVQPTRPMEQFEQCILSKGQNFPAHERLAWSVFFTIYKNYRTGCCREWFLHQLERLSGKLKCASFVDFMERIKEDFPSHPTNKECTTPTSGHGNLHLHVPGTVCSAMAPRTVSSDSSPLSLNSTTPSPGNNSQPDGSPQQSLEMRQLFLSNFTHVASLSITVTKEEVVTVVLNEHFTTQFGVSEMKPFGLLPWGADVLCYVIPSEADVLAFLQVCAINFPGGSCGTNCTRTVASTHTPHVLLPNGETVPCLVKCVHRESVCGGGKSKLHVDMTFEPVVGKQPMFALEDGDDGLGMGLDSPYLPLTDLCMTNKSPYSPFTTTAAQAAGVVGRDDPGEALFPELDFGLEDDLFFSDLFEFATQEYDSIGNGGEEDGLL